MNLQPIDYVVLFAYFVFVLAIGFYVRRKIATSSDFLTAGHRIPTWMASLAFLAANLGAQEVIGMCASGAKYGIMTAHFYWAGAVPAMLFVGVFMMPFYYGSRARSVPEYLKLRFDEKTRGLNALTFALMTIFSSGASMKVLAQMFQLIAGWSFETSVLASSAIVLTYTLLGGLTSAIYNEVAQFFLIVIGFTPLAWMAVSQAGGWSGITARVPEVFGHAWTHTGSAAANPMGIEAFGLVFGLAFVLSFGYWCTDFLVVQRAMAAENMAAARRVPVLATFPKMLMPFIVILPGIAALALMNTAGSGYAIPSSPGGGLDYDQTMTTLLAHYYPAGLLGLGVTALMASFMSGMAGNTTAFNTVFTYDLYQSYIRPNAPDHHYLTVARWTTIGGIALSVGAAYLAKNYNNMMDFLQLVFSFVNAPLFATFLLGMFWKRATGDGAFWGLLGGSGTAALVWSLTVAEGKGGLLGRLHEFPSSMAQNFWIAIFAWTACFLLTIGVSLFTAPRPDAELGGLVYGLTPRENDAGMAWYLRPGTLALIAGAACLALNFVFA